MAFDARDVLLQRLRTDLCGPGAEEEVISDRPSDRYLTGIIYARRTLRAPEEEDEAGDAETGREDGDPTLDGVRASATFRPGAAGLSFAIELDGDEGALSISMSGGRYLGHLVEDGKTERRRDAEVTWRRAPCSAQELILVSGPEARTLPMSAPGFEQTSLSIRTARLSERALLVTVALSNTAALGKSADRIAAEEASLFQVALSVECEEMCRFIPKPDRTALAGDADADAASLLFRDVPVYAVGHTCSANWDKDEAGQVVRVRTDWFPEADVHAISPYGDVAFAPLREAGAEGPLGADWLASADGADLAKGLFAFVEAYEGWIERTRERAAKLPVELRRQGKIHLDECEKVAARMRRGADLASSSPQVRDAFRFANKAISIQYEWRRGSEPMLWRPFQLGFALLSIESLADPRCDDRDVMDLLWFPTGGGKTEAYLLLAAFTIFLRRLRAEGLPSGAGVTAFMRYTLRLLTIQQFERAAALIFACELIRIGAREPGAARIPDHFASDAPISLGLWVGDAATPNRIERAIEALRIGADSTPRQLRVCPACGGEIICEPSSDAASIETRCPAPGCRLGEMLDPLPVWTVDDDIYRVRPTLVIGTVDKYAQIVRKDATGRLFGRGTPHDPPELIIQDELHLISGPLGSLAGLYEVAVDELCRASDGSRAKIIGSTATIRQAREQIGALFDRRSCQFPPPGLDHRDSGFAVEDSAGETGPGRRYVGVTTAGRSAKFTLQAVAASLLQSPTDPGITDEARDGYWTLVNYFNSLRELGGALVLMRDDVVRTIEEFADRRNEDPRAADTQVELTSRVPSSEIPRYLNDLVRSFEDEDHVDVVLASNMISVGMDVSRLGLMLVNGQPKTVAEYIQATSRVGRDKKAPGLVVTLYNVAKSRDRSRYETFAGWHGSLYREVEPTGVTPFAPRARDRALHAPFVAMARHLIPGLENAPGRAADFSVQLHRLIDVIVDRIRRIDPEEAEDAAAALEDFLENWEARSSLTSYWDDRNEALLMSAEKAAEIGRRASRDPRTSTPNSLRSVEASTAYVLTDTRRVREREPDARDGRRRRR